jgi:hypothetical protein
MKHTETDLRCKGLKTDEELFEEWLSIPDSQCYVSMDNGGYLVLADPTRKEELAKELGKKLGELRLKHAEQQIVTLQKQLNTVLDEMNELSKRKPKRRWFQFSK